MNFISKLFDTDFMPHGHCYFWRPEILWPHVLGDGFTAIAYFIIPVLLWYFLKKRNDLEFSNIFWAFAAFILCCGTTHALAMVSVWNPIYRLEAIMKVLTALVSIGTVYLLIRRLPEIIALPSPAQLGLANKQLRLEIDHRKAAEAEITALNADLEMRVEERTTELRQANEDLEFYTSMISHDLNSPLKNLEIVIDMIKNDEEQLSGDGQEALTAMSQGVTKMNRLVDGLLQLSKSGQQQFHLDRIDLNKTVKGIVKMLQTNQESANHEVSIDDLPIIQGDAVLIQELFQNLLSNAFKYSSKQEHPKIKIGWRKKDSGVEIYIEDNGVGFDPAKKMLIFDRFSRAHKNDEFEGSGVGLAIVKRVIERHGGTISAASEPGQGAIFTIYFPNDKQMVSDSE